MRERRRERRLPVDLAITYTKNIITRRRQARKCGASLGAAEPKLNADRPAAGRRRGVDEQLKAAVRETQPRVARRAVRQRARPRDCGPADRRNGERRVAPAGTVVSEHAHAVLRR